MHFNANKSIGTTHAVPIHIDCKKRTRHLSAINGIICIIKMCSYMGYVALLPFFFYGKNMMIGIPLVPSYGVANIYFRMH